MTTPATSSTTTTSTTTTSTTTAAAGTTGEQITPTGRVLTAALLVAPLVYLAADSTYAVRGWDDGTAGVVHVLGAIAYGFVVLRVATWLPPASRLAALLLVTGFVGTAGNVAYGFDAIHASLGDVPLVDQPGAANLVKPLGLFFPVSFLLVALALARLGHRRRGAVVLLTMIAWPVAHIGDVATLAVAVDAVLVVALGSLAWTRRRERSGPDGAGGRPVPGGSALG